GQRIYGIREWASTHSSAKGLPHGAIPSCNIGRTDAAGGTERAPDNEFAVVARKGIYNAAVDPASDGFPRSAIPASDPPDHDPARIGEIPASDQVAIMHMKRVYFRSHSGPHRIPGVSVKTYHPIDSEAGGVCKSTAHNQ